MAFPPMSTADAAEPRARRAAAAPAPRALAGGAARPAPASPADAGRRVLVAPTGRHRRSSGQALVEYAIVAGLLMASLAILTLFLGTFKEYGDRIAALVSSEYP